MFGPSATDSLSWIDEEEDVCRITNQAELDEALRAAEAMNKVLLLTISKPTTPVVETQPPKAALPTESMLVVETQPAPIQPALPTSSALPNMSALAISPAPGVPQHGSQIEQVDRLDWISKHRPGRHRNLMKRFNGDTIAIRAHIQAHKGNFQVVSAEVETKLNYLASMGFENRRKNLKFLQKCNGNVGAVVNILLRQSQKRKLGDGGPWIKEKNKKKSWKKEKKKNEKMQEKQEEKCGKRQAKVLQKAEKKAAKLAKKIAHLQCKMGKLSKQLTVISCKDRKFFKAIRKATHAANEANHAADEAQQKLQLLIASESGAPGAAVPQIHEGNSSSSSESSDCETDTGMMDTEKAVEKAVEKATEEAAGKVTEGATTFVPAQVEDLTSFFKTPSLCP